MKLAILGSGSVGSALARAWLPHGHSVCFGARDPAAPELAALVRALGPKASAATRAQAAQGAEVLALATPWGPGGAKTRAALEACGDLAGKIVVDCTNPLREDLSGLEIGHERSGGELVATWARGASVFKAFNHTGANNMQDASGYAQRPLMLVAGDDGAKKPLVLKLASEAGFDAVDAGGLSASRLLEPLAMLWVHLAYRQGLGREFAFALLRRAPRP